MLIANICLPLPIPNYFSYLVKETSQPPQPFSRALVPFGRKKLIGFVIELTTTSPTAQPLKYIEEIIDETPLFTEDYVQWLQWMSRYYHLPLGMILHHALPKALFTPKSLAELAEKKSRSQAWQKNKSLEQKPIQLTSAQQNILNTLIEKRPAYSLLHGITGSGKTEVYLEFIKQLLAEGKQALLLVPEIGLTPQMIARLQHHFGDQLGVYHSGLTVNQRLQEWRQCRDNKPRLTIGTRSAIFLPYQNLGAIIIDEEHDSSYKQEEQFRYHARHLALMRAKLMQFQVLMGSATPSLESYQLAQTDKYKLFSLQERPGKAKLADVSIINMAAQTRQLGKHRLLCKELHQALEKNLHRGEQSLILINRRGFAHCYFCLECQQGITCPNCSVSLTYHKSDHQLHCHYCEVTTPVPQECPYCQQPSLTMIGQGTQSIEEEILTFFPKARISRLDRDVIQKKGELFKILDDLKQGHLDIVIGTQMLAKGHDIPMVTLVGVIGVDNLLSMPDFRSAEKTFQLITQVAGRAGRGQRSGQVIIQSYLPSHESIVLASKQDYPSFFARETARRKELFYPPFGYLIQFLISSASLSKLQKFLQKFEQLALKLPDQVNLLGPAPAPLETLRGRHRWQITLKSPQRQAIHQATNIIRQHLSQLKISGVKWAIDVDPMGML